MEREKLEDLIKIWSNKSFSPVEKAMEKAMKMDATPVPPTPPTTTPTEPKQSTPTVQIVTST